MPPRGGQQVPGLPALGAPDGGGSGNRSSTETKKPLSVFAFSVPCKITPFLEKLVLGFAEDLGCG